MNKEGASKIIEVYGKPRFKVGKTTISFARQDENSIAEIEKMDDDLLISEWKGLVFINDIYGQISLGDLQRISLLELEISGRNIDKNSLKKWYDTEKQKFEESEFYENET